MDLNARSSVREGRRPDDRGRRGGARAGSSPGKRTRVEKAFAGATRSGGVLAAPVQRRASEDASYRDDLAFDLSGKNAPAAAVDVNATTNRGDSSDPADRQEKVARPFTSSGLQWLEDTDEVHLKQSLAKGTASLAKAEKQRPGGTARLAKNGPTVAQLQARIDRLDEMLAMLTGAASEGTGSAQGEKP